MFITSAGIPFGDRHRLVAEEKGKQIPAFPRMKPIDASVENPKVFEDGGVSRYAGTIVAICG